jgi:hypothetical protein
MSAASSSRAVFALGDAPATQAQPAVRVSSRVRMFNPATRTKAT